MSRPTDCSQHPRPPESPLGYAQYMEWMDAMAETHDQVFCDECERWRIWRPKPTSHIAGQTGDES